MKPRHECDNAPTAMMPMVGTPQHSGRTNFQPGGLNRTVQRAWANQAVRTHKKTSHTPAILLILAILATVVLFAAGCGTASVEGTVVNKTQRVEAVCVKWETYKAGKKTRCRTYVDEMHNYLVILPDGTKRGGKTQEVKVSLELYEQTKLGDHYPTPTN